MNKPVRLREIITIALIAWLAISIHSGAKVKREEMAATSACIDAAKTRYEVLACPR